MIPLNLSFFGGGGGGGGFPNTSGGYTPPDGGGGITSTIIVNGKTVTVGHGARHLAGTGLTANQVNQAIANEVSKMQLGAGQFYKGQITVNGVKIEYTSYGVRDNVINIGTYYPIQ